MPEKVTVSHRGARYEIGRGKRYYGIWVTGAPESDPVDRWPETPDGWAQAWTRFVALETPQTITAVDERGGFKFPAVRVGALKGGRGSAAWVAAGLLAAGVLLGVIGLFPNYSGSSLASQAVQLVPHLVFLAGWAVSAAVVAAGARRGQAGGARLRAGALFGAGLSAVTLGLLLTDLAQAATSGSPDAVGAGLVLSLVGWAACAAGSATGLSRRDRKPEQSGQPGRPVRPGKEHAGPIALLVLGALGTVASFAPSWDSFTLRSAAGTETITAGNAFSNPGAVIAANVLVMVVVVVVAFAAAVWRPSRQGATLLAGAIVPMAAQAISAVIQVSQPASPGDFGLSPSQAAEAGLSISSSLTPVFWVYCVFVVALAISCAWLLTEPAQPAGAGPVPSTWAGPLLPPGGNGGDEGPGGGEPEDDSENSYA